MTKLKAIVIGAMTLFVLLCGYWALGRNIMIDRIGTTITDMQSEGYKVVHNGLSVGGFPLKFRARLSEPDIASPRALEKPWSIKADDWRMEAAVFNPLKWTAVHRGDARIDMRGPKGERWLFDARPFNVNVTLRAKTDGTPKAVDITSTKLTAQAVIGTLPPVIAIGDARLSASPADNDMRFEADLKNLFLDKETLKELQKIFGPRLESISGFALAIGLTSLDGDSIHAWKQNGVLTGEGFDILWGGTVLRGGFNFTLSEAGLSGVIRLNVDDIQGLISRLEEADIFTARQVRNATLAANLLPVTAEGGREVTLTVRDGFLTLFGQKIFEL